MQLFFSRRKWLVWSVPVSNLTATGAAVGQVRDVNDAINKAGRQRMLSQRMAKSYLALGQGVRREQADKVLADSMALFDRQLAELRAFAPSADLRSTYEQLETAWSAYKGHLVGATPSRAGAETVLASSNQVLALAHRGTTQLEALSGKAVGRLVNVAGRQRMLSQRMASMYLGASWGVQAGSSVKEMNMAREEFVKAHADLMQAPESTQAIKGELTLAAQQHGFFDAALRALTGSAVNAQARADVFTTSERILQVMDEVTGMYARLS